MASTSNQDDPRRQVRLEPERVSNVAGNEFPGHYPGEDHSWNLKKFTENLQVKVDSITPSKCEFDLVGVDSSIANAFRRVMIAEVPTMAFEEVYIQDNTSIVQDEVLSHRLGLIPLRIDPRAFRMVNGEGPNDKNTVIFELKIRCTRNPDAKKGETDPSKLYINDCVYSSALKWKPVGKQKSMFKDDPPRAAVDDILIAKLRPGQALDIQLHAVKGIGKDHAKFSPVATASYRLLPRIVIKEPIPVEDSLEFARCFAPGVIGFHTKGKVTTVKVLDARKDTVSREVLRHEKFRDKVELTRIRDHFIYSVESTGAYKPEEMLPEAINVLLGKVNAVEGCLRQVQSQLGQDPAPAAAP